MKTTIVQPFGSRSGPPFFDKDEKVDAIKQVGGLYTVRRDNGQPESAANTVRDVPARCLALGEDHSMKRFLAEVAAESNAGG